MAILQEFIKVDDLNNKGQETNIVLTDVANFAIITDDDGEYSADGEPSDKEYFWIAMNDGTIHVFECNMAYAVLVTKSIMQLKAAAALGLRTNKVFVY
jgi:hypothetical protein